MTITVQDLTKTYGAGETATHALRGVSFTIGDGELVVLLGASGSGKTTCLNILGAIESPTSGKVEVAGTSLTELDREDRTTYRRDNVGFVFQFYNLVPTLSALENVQLVAELGAAGPGEASRTASTEALAAVGLTERLDHFPAQLSGGQQQRVAVARALAKGPELLLCDEPTGALDLETGQQVLALLRRAADDGRTVLIVTHNSVIAEMADRVLHLSDGRLDGDERNPDAKPATELHW